MFRTNAINALRENWAWIVSVEGTAALSEDHALITYTKILDRKIKNSVGVFEEDSLKIHLDRIKVDGQLFTNVKRAIGVGTKETVI